MVFCDTCFSTLVLVSTFLVVVSLGQTSWDIAVTNGQQIDFFLSNGTNITAYKVAGSKSLIGLAFDNVTQNIYVSDKNASVLSKFKPFSTTESANQTTMWSFKGKHAIISTMVFDPTRQTLFWTDSWNHTLVRMKIQSNGANDTPETLLNLPNLEPSGIALDICNGYIYWVNHKETVANHSISRWKIDEIGETEPTIIISGLYKVYNMVVDHYTGKLYWLDDTDGVSYRIERSNLDGTKREIFFDGTDHEPGYIAVDSKFVYWTDYRANTVHKMNKIRGSHDEPKPFALYGTISISSIITRENAGNIDCKAMKQKQELEANNHARQDNEEKSFTDVTNSNKKENSSSNQSNINNCSNNGRYNSKTDTCSCEQGFTGNRCDIIDQCFNYCIHGSCVIDDNKLPRCDCDNLYSGDRCEIDICNGYCLNNGVCSVSDKGPVCKCDNYEGTRCEYSTELRKICFRCSGLNDTLSGCITASEQLMQSTIIPSVLIAVIGTLVIVVGVLSYHINKLRRRPRIRKRFVVSKGGVTPLTSRPQAPADSCEITIENCCNMNICETPCFEPKLRTTPTKSSSTKKEEKNSLLDSMEGADSC